MSVHDQVVYSRHNGLAFTLEQPKNAMQLMANAAIMGAGDGNLFERKKPRSVGVNIRDGVIVNDEPEASPTTDLELAAQRVAEREAKQAEDAKQALQGQRNAAQSEKRRKALAEIAAAVQANKMGDEE